MTTRTRVSLEAFLALPETKPYRELWDGEVVEKAMPSRTHSRLVRELLTELTNYLRTNPIASADTELRHAEVESGWVFLPDVSVTLHSRRPGSPVDAAGPEEVLPDFAIEVLSPGDRPGQLARRIASYMSAGVTLLWVVDPEDEHITVWERGSEPRLATPGEALSAAPVLPGFSINLTELFATLHEA